MMQLAKLVQDLWRAGVLQRALVAEFYQRSFNEELPQSTANVVMS